MDHTCRFQTSRTHFPDFRSRKLIIKPGKLIHKIVQRMMTKEKKLGVVIPSSEQIEQTKKKWIDLNPVVAVASPYEDSERAAEATKNASKKRGFNAFRLHRIHEANETKS